MAATRPDPRRRPRHRQRRDRAGAEASAPATPRSPRTDVSAGGARRRARNADRLGLAIELVEASWWHGLEGRRFDLAIANPPYIAGDDPHLAALRHEPALALTPGGDGLGRAAGDRRRRRGAPRSGRLAAARARLRPGRRGARAARRRRLRRGRDPARPGRSRAGDRRSAGRRPNRRSQAITVRRKGALHPVKKCRGAARIGAGAASAQQLFRAHRRTMISGRRTARCIPVSIEESPMRNVLWICAAVASALTLADARAEGDGLSADADRVPWARFQSRIAYAPGAPGWRADLAPLERSGLQVSSVGLLGDVYFGSTPAPPGDLRRRLPRHQRRPDRRAQPGLGAVSTPTSGLLATDRRLFGASAAPLDLSGRSDGRQHDAALHRHRLQQPVDARAAGTSAPTWASSRRAPATWSASAASSAARRASTTSSATCAWRRWSSSASRIPSDPLDPAFAGKVA